MDDDEHGDLAQQLAAEAKSAEAKSRGKKGSKKAGQAAKVCFVCPELAMKGKRWCTSHNRAYDCMYYQAKSKGEVTTLERAMMDAQRAREAVDAFMLDNPAEGKWRRKSLIDWGAFRRTYCVTQTKRKRDGCRQFEYGQWMLRGKNEMGWTDESSKAEWQKYHADKSIERDSMGLNGALRLWLPVINEKHKDDSVARTNAFEEGSSSNRNLSEEDRLILLNHVRASGQHDDDEWVSALAAAEGDEDDMIVTPKKRPAPDAAAETPAEKKVRVKREKLANNGPGFAAYKQNLAEKIREKGQSVLRMVDNGKEKLLEGEKAAKDSETDNVLTSYLKTLSDCMAIVKIWRMDVALDDDAVAKATESLGTTLEGASQQIKIVKDGACLKPKAFFEWQAKSLLSLSEPKLVDEAFEAAMKTDAPVVELFAKSLAKIGNDVQSYVKTKKRNKERAEAKEKKLKESKGTSRKLPRQLQPRFVSSKGRLTTSLQWITRSSRASS